MNGINVGLNAALRTTRRLLFAFATLVAAASAAAGAIACGSKAAAPAAAPASPSPAVPQSSSAPLLEASHPGTRNPQCAACHALPAAGHTATAPPACAACHGANGACDPNGRSGVRRHAHTDNCTGCHQPRHGFTANADCTACHFASRGTRACVA